MKTSKWCNENINGKPLRWDAVISELEELLEVKNFQELREELSDVIYSTICAIHTYSKISLPMIGANYTIQKARDRFKVWEVIFKENGLKFDKKYLINGSNYNKEIKVKLALELARNSGIRN